MREVNLLCHYVEPAKLDYPLPVEDIVAFFRTARVSLQLVEVPRSLRFDPNGKSGEGYQAVVASLPNEPLGTAHLYVGIEPPSGAWAMAGQLLDLERRRAAVVYTNSTYISGNRTNGLLQTAVHEIGHMLNLDHSLPGTDPTAMHQALYRTGEDFERSWKRVKTDAVGAAEAFFIPPNRTIQCYPFSLSDRVRLNIVSDDIILPGGQKYQFSSRELNE